MGDMDRDGERWRLGLGILQGSPGQHMATSVSLLYRQNKSIVWSFPVPEKGNLSKQA